MSNIGKGKKGEAVVLADNQHLGKVADALFAKMAGPEDPSVKEILRPRHSHKGPSVRRVFRRRLRRLSAQDLQAQVFEKRDSITAKPRAISQGKRVKTYQKRLDKYINQARKLTALLILSAWRYHPSARPDFMQAPPKMDAYHQRIAERGTSISKANANTQEVHGEV